MTPAISSVYALKYASRPECLASEAFYRHDLYGESDRAIGMDYFFWIAHNGDDSVVIDCGFDPEIGRARHREIEVPPAELLARVGTNPADIKHVVLSHMHFDHVGNTDLFPNATFYMARKELEYWTGPCRDRPNFSWSVAPEEVRLVESLHRDGRLLLVDDDTEIVPGVRTLRYPGHTPGQLVTTVESTDRTVVIASDAAHYYAEIDHDRPFYIFTDMEKLFASYDSLRVMSSRPDVDVVPGHDPLVSRRYAEVEPGCFDLTRRC